MSISAIGSFTLLGEQYWSSVALLVAIFLPDLPENLSLWAHLACRWLAGCAHPQAWRRFNLAMGLLTAACVVMIWR
jgi:hypothetical protein